MIKTKYPKITTATDYKKFGYVLVKPSSMPSGTVPIIIVGHGQGEIGDGTDSQLDRVSNWPGFAALQKSVDDFKIVFIHLQTSSRYQYGEIQAGIAFAKSFPYCDVNNIHYYGVSLGGYGFFQQSAASSTFPANFATIALMAPGPGNVDLTGDNIGLSGRPIWILHGHNDCVVGVSNSQNVINDINAHGGAGKTWISIWKDRTTCSGCCISPCPSCSQTTTKTISGVGTCTSACEAAHNMVSILVGESWNIVNTVNNVYNSLPTYPLNSGKGLKEISAGTLAKMGWHQWVKSNKKGQVIIPPTNIYGGSTNTAPVASAGFDKSITLPTNSTTLTGTASDPGGAIVAYAWSKVSGPNCTIQSPSTATTVIQSMTEGTYVFRLTVTDNGGLTDTDDVTIVVNPAPVVNQAPVARAGLDLIITLPTNSITLNGVTSSDEDGTIVSYLWTQTSGGVATIANPNSVSTQVTDLTTGTYVFKLEVTDDDGLKATDSITVTVEAQPPPPVTILVTFKVYSDGTVEKI